MNVSLSTNVTWTQSKSTSFGSVNQGPASVGFSLTGLASSWNCLFAAQYTLAASGTQDVDLYSFTDLLSQATGMRHVLSLNVQAQGGPVTLGPAASNGLVWFFGGTTPTVAIKGNFLYSLDSSSTGQVVDATHRKLTLTNLDVVLAATVTVVAIGSTT